MELSIKAELQYRLSGATDLLLQIEPCSDDGQTCAAADLEIAGEPPSRALPGDDGVGMRRWVVRSDMFECRFEARVHLHRAVPPLAALAADPFQDLPPEVVPYLMPSRFCHSEQFVDFVRAQFGADASGAIVSHMASWIRGQFRYDPAASLPGMTATDSFHASAGVCRDYAHMLITFARAMGVPARYVSVYGHAVYPQDFHAVAEVWLDGAWQLIDPTGMTHPAEVARIGVGRDAADVSFLTSYGPVSLISQQVDVTIAQR